MTKLRLAAIVALCLAALSWVAETIFYGGVTAEGVVQESFFMPLTFLLAAIGVALFIVSLFRSRRS